MNKKNLFCGFVIIFFCIHRTNFLIFLSPYLIEIFIFLLSVGCKTKKNIFLDTFCGILLFSMAVPTTYYRQIDTNYYYYYNGYSFRLYTYMLLHSDREPSHTLVYDTCSVGRDVTAFFHSFFLSFSPTYIYEYASCFILLYYLLHHMHIVLFDRYYTIVYITLSLFVDDGLLRLVLFCFW